MFRIPLALAFCLSLAAGAQAQDAGNGERVFAACKLCHQLGVDAKSVAGPELNGIIGRRAGTVAGFAYSAANKSADITWTGETLAAFLRDPKGVLPGNKMLYAGLKDDQKIADLIAFLRQYDANGRKAP